MLWPDWTGETLAIVASGPSAKKAGVAALRGRAKVLAIKKTIELVPWADAVYGCDGPWWQDVRGLPKFHGVKMSYTDRACDEFGLLKVEIPDKKSSRLMFGHVGVVGAGAGSSGGGNSGFQALNLAIQFGAKRVLLIGFDMHCRSGEHWYGRNGWNLANNPTEDNFRRWRSAFEVSASDLEARGIDVINASEWSDLKCFRKMTIEQALQTWGLQNAA